MTTRPWVVDDDLWAWIEPLLPPWPYRSPGRKPVDDRLWLQCILQVLHQDISWQPLPLELGFGSGQTCWRRLDRRQKAGVFGQLHCLLLAEMHAVGELDWSRASVDGPRPRQKGGAATGPSPVDRRKTGSKNHLIRDGRGTPLHVITTAANVNDVTRSLHLVDGIQPVAGRPGRPRRRPESVLGDKAYDSKAVRSELRRRRIMPVISRKGAQHIQGLGELRYVVEQTFALLHQFKRLAVRWERRIELHDASLSLACILIGWRRPKGATS
ncbi:IS5 family transposase [Streptomyces sp. NPDC058683]|uniref:IS5 family transposase n=1 Tax=Streptomyces sp. NPDC058683 TaxID=3346597 RepID=UPI0036561907